MVSRRDGSSFGSRLRRTALVFAVPLVLAALAIGHYRACSAACQIARPGLIDADAQRIVDFMKVSLQMSARYFWGSVALGAALLFVAMRMARRQAELGDEMEGLVRNTLHRLSHSLSAIREEAGGIRSGRMASVETAAAIESLSTKEAEMISAYMLLVKGFAGFDESNAEPVNLSAVACRVVADVNVREKKDVEIRCSVPEKDVFIRAHSYLVGEVVGNLVDNAVKYTDGGSVSVSVESAGRYARLTVSDTGRGIPRGEQKAVFRRFYRASNAGDRVGSGLGLATVREIVESRYGGKVSLSSAPGMGATVTVTFPHII
jgi:signal transduction histidine kinase